MKRFMFAVAVLAMAATGCANTGRFLLSKSDSNDNFANASAPDTGVNPVNYNAPIKADGNVQQTNGFFYGLTNNHLQNCSYDQCCESSCGYPECCCDECCDTCCDCGSGCGKSKGGLLGTLLGKRKKKKSCSSGQCYDGCSECCGDCNNGCGGRLGQRMAGCIASGGCGCCPHSVGYPEPVNFTPGPQGGQVAYPYYTTRGPRDFLMCNPQPLGPY